MKPVKVAIFIILFCVFPARIVVQWAPILGLPLVATAISMTEYACLFFLLVRFISDHAHPVKSQSFRILYVLYWIYCAYLIYYVIINPQMQREMMSHISKNNFDIILPIFETGLLLPIVVNYQRYLNIKLFAKVSTLFVFFVLLVYSYVSDMSLYLYERTLPLYELTRFNMADHGMLDSLTMGEFCSITMLFNFSVRKQWTQNKYVNGFVFVGITVFLFFLLFLVSQRGPILFMVLTLLFYYFAKGKIKRTLLISFLFITIILLLFGTFISDFLSSNDFSLIERFMNIGEDGGSGRFGDEDAEYNLALRQIVQGPLFGSYFRINIGTRIGDYPHNFVLELLMTFGFVFTIPFLAICWRGIKRSYSIIKADLPMTVFCLLFLDIYACHLTSYTIASSNNMWLILAMIVGCKELNISYPPLKKYKSRTAFGE